MAAQGYIGRAPGESSVIVARQTFTPTGITTNFTFASGYTVGYVDAYLNGARLIEGSDYTATDGSVVGLTTHAQNGDVLELVVYKAFNVSNVVAAKDDFSVPGDLSVTGNTDVTGTLTVGGVEVQPGAAGTWATFTSGGEGGISTSKKVKIENGLEVTGISTFSGALTVGGVLTYDDVTNVDSIGIITARSHVSIADSILHTGDTDTSIRFPAAGTFTVETNGSERVRVIDEGAIVTGIATVISTTADDSSNAYNFVIRGNDSGTDDESAQIFLGAINSTTRGTAIAAQRQSSSNNHDLIFKTSGLSAVPTEKVRITSTGLVGIGTAAGSSSSSRLVVYEESGNAQTIEIKAKTTGGAGAQPGIRFTAPNNDNIGAIYGDVNSDSLQLATGGSERIRITGIGSVGIGENDPLNRVHIAGADHQIRIEDTANGNNVQIQVDGPGDNFNLDWVSSNDRNINLINSGSGGISVGVGTTVPAGVFQVEAASTTDMIMLNVAGTNFARLGHNSASGTDLLDVRSEGHTRFLTNGNNERVRIRSTGLVGIATVLPEAQLTVKGDGVIAAKDFKYLYSNTHGIQVKGNEAAIDIVGTDNGNHGSSLLLRTSLDGFGMFFDPTRDQLRFMYTVPSADDFSIHDGGNTSTNTEVLTIGKTGICTATQFDATSDVALKENIEVIDEPIVKLSELKGVTFDWKAGGHSVGVIAQDVEKVLPTAVGGSEDRKTVNYNAIIGLLVESVKDQQKQIEELKSLLDK